MASKAAKRRKHRREKRQREVFATKTRNSTSQQKSVNGSKNNPLTSSREEEKAMSIPNKGQLSTIESICNPVTMTGGILEAMRFLVRSLNKEIRPEDKRTMFHVLHGSMTDRLKRYGFVNNHAIVMTMAGRLGVIRLHKKGIKTTWSVLDYTFFDGFDLDDEYINRRVYEQERYARMRDERMKEVIITESQGKSFMIDPALMEEIGKTIAALDQKKVEIKGLLKQLANEQDKSEALAERLLAKDQDASLDLAAAIRKARGE